MAPKQERRDPRLEEGRERPGQTGKERTADREPKADRGIEERQRVKKAGPGEEEEDAERDI